MILRIDARPVQPIGTVHVVGFLALDGAPRRRWPPQPGTDEPYSGTTIPTPSGRDEKMGPETHVAVPTTHDQRVVAVHQFRLVDDGGSVMCL